MDDTSATIAEQLAEFALSAPLPPAVTDSVVSRIVDTVGLMTAAARLDTSVAVAQYAAAAGGDGQATAIGVADRLPAASAALVNGTLAHSLDFDDTHLPSVLHPSASVVPAALAAAEWVDADAETLLRAIGTGLEVCVRLGMAGYDETARNSVFFEHGQHATSICGTVASALAAGTVLGLDAAGLVSSMGVAASMAGGIIEANRTGGTVKRLHCGWAAHGGVTAASLVQAGITGPPTVFEGRFGFFQAFLRDDVDLARVTDQLGDHWEVPGIFFKPYPANHFTHAGIDAARRLRERGLRPDQIRSAHLGVAPPTVRTIGEPLEIKQRPETGYQAQFSGPYTVVAGLLGSSGLGVGLADFTDELAQDPERRQLMARITVGPDERCAAIYPDQFPAVLTVETTDGEVIVEEVLANRGGPQWPLTADELDLKFAENVAGVVDTDTRDSLTAAIRSLSTSHPSRVDDLLAPLRQLEPVVAAT